MCLGLNSLGVHVTSRSGRGPEVISDIHAIFHNSSANFYISEQMCALLTDI